MYLVSLLLWCYCCKVYNEKSYLCTYDLYGPVRNAFDAGSILYEGKWEGGGPWKSRLFWVLWNGIEPMGECHLGPKKVEHYKFIIYSLRNNLIAYKCTIIF